MIFMHPLAAACSKLHAAEHAQQRAWSISEESHAACVDRDFIGSRVLG